MKQRPTTFALFFGNRRGFPASLIEQARTEITGVLRKLGYDSLLLDPEATRFGGVETGEEARRYAEFLRENQGKFDGVILSLPNFGDENGAALALKEAGVPIFVQAYPDELDKMSPAERRDSFCGKISVMDVFQQFGIPFTIQKPHVVAPGSPAFEENIEHFARICRIVGGVRGMVVGEMGARTTPFKTVRIDELALQKHDITVETFDLSDVFARIKAVSPDTAAYSAKREHLRGIGTWENVPDAATDNLVRLGVVLDAMVDEYQMDAISIRCWTEIQEQFGISPCLITGDLMDRGIPAACEVDTGSAVAMHILGLASEKPTAILDWNNNYGDDPDKCILFHCGNAPAGLIVEGTGRVTDHDMLAGAIGAGRGYGCHQGRFVSGPFTFNNLLSENGSLKMYLGEGQFTEDPIPSSFFGCAGVAEIPGLQDLLLYIGRSGHRHHVALTPGSVRDSITEALENYLDFEVTAF